MDTKSVQEKLQKAYHSMLENVEELVEKDKKPLKEAFEIAEEKLSEWRELSREEVENISEELKENLSEMGEATHRLNESLKETLSFDASYLASSIWNRLSKVADQTKVELVEFREDLRKHMKTDASTRSEQQQVWFNDAFQWQTDYENAIKKLDEVRAEIRKNIREANTYSKAIGRDKTDQAEHDLLAQKHQETTQYINDLYLKFFGDKS